MPWDRVHDEAEVLEHYISEELEERIAAALGDPSHDPHGDPIPDRELASRRSTARPWPSSRPAREGTFAPRLRLRSRDAPLPRRARDRARGRSSRSREREPFGGPLTVERRGLEPRDRRRARPADADRRPGASDRLAGMALAADFKRFSTRFPTTGPTSARPAAAGRGRYVDAAVILTQVNAQPYSKADWHWRINVAHKFGHAAAAETVMARWSCSTRGDRGRARPPRLPRGPGRGRADVGPPGVRAPRVPRAPPL